MTSFSTSNANLRFLAACNLLWCIWTERNELRYNDELFCLIRFKHFFLNSLKESASLSFSSCSSLSSALPIFILLGLSSLRRQAPRFILVVWCPPPSNWLKVNTDGSFRNPNLAGFGGIFRDSKGLFHGAFSFNVKIPNVTDAEILAKQFELLGFGTGLIFGSRRIPLWCSYGRDLASLASYRFS
ncbi:hypothetical protein M0R45_025995 [Rubus argutus]|uniref:RNase H type-1 domain-containing protein n=1 Tax=Rubus argutus TaxID=59490 RepID=A0AAW1WZL5_RUBAR